MSTHTPGPWQHYDFGPKIDIGPYILALTADPNGDSGPQRGFTVTCGVTGTGASTYWPARGIGGMSDEERIANARLIAAAPELLAMVRLIYSREGWQSAKDLIEKATGAKPQ